MGIPADEVGTHMSHCNQGEYTDSCKYGDFDSCPALNKPTSDWQSIDNTPPERGNKVLVFSTDKNVRLGFLPNLPDPMGASEFMSFMKKKDHLQFYMAGTRDKIVYPVTHWMPLPSKPKDF